MWRFLLGFSTGIYVGTYFECKPVIEKIEQFVKDNFPKSK